MENRKIITDKFVMFHHDADGVLRDFHGYAMELFHNKYPEYKQYQVPANQIRGWQFEDEYWPLDKAKEVDQLMTELFFGGEFTYEVFRHAPSLVTEEQWSNHIVQLKNAFPNCRIVISTHQYTLESKIATLEWLDENGIGYEDLLFTGEKDLFGAHYLLDDKPQMVERFNNNGSVGVLLKRERGNGWYRRKHPDITFGMVDSLEEFTKSVLTNERVMKKYKSIEYSLK